MGKTQVVMIIVVVAIAMAIVPTIGAAQTGPGYDIGGDLSPITFRDAANFSAFIDLSVLPA
jgi:hypothetical protein